MIEQAIFTSAQTDRSRGYQLVAASPGINAQAARDLAAWGPSHGSLCGASDNASSVNFHPLTDDLWCISQSVSAGEEYSGRGGTRVYTHSFAVPAEEMGRFANNPFALLRATRTRGLLKVQDFVPSSLAAIQLPGRAGAVDEGVLAEFLERFGEERIAWLVDVALTADRLLVVGVDNRDLLMAGLIQCLPVECRPEMSFATGLVHSPRRPFRINALELDAVETKRLSRQSCVTVLNLAEEPPADFVPSGWAAYLFEAFAVDGLPVLCAELERARAGLRVSDLPWLADQLTERLHEGGDVELARPQSSPGELVQPPGGNMAADSAYERPAGKLQLLPTVSAEANLPARANGPSAEVVAPSRDALEMLEHLDDLVFDTINGRSPALDELTALWPRLSAELSANLLAESREQYLHYAIKVWELCVKEGVRDPSCAVAALDVLCILFGGD